MTRVKQQGSVIGFVMVGLVLAALVIGGIYAVRNQVGDYLAGGPEVEQSAPEATDDAAAPDETDTESAEQPTNDGSDEAERPAEDTPAEAPDDTAASSNDASTDSDTTTSDDTTVAGTSTESRDQTLSQAGVDTTSQPESSNLPTTGVELPQTGVSDVLWSALPIAALVGAVFAYRRSNML